MWNFELLLAAGVSRFVIRYFELRAVTPACGGMFGVALGRLGPPFSLASFDCNGRSTRRGRRTNKDPNIVPRRPQEVPKRTQEGPKTAQDGPRGP